MNFPSKIGQRVRISDETGVLNRGESGIIKQIDGKYFIVEITKTEIVKINKIYLSVIDFVKENEIRNLIKINNKTINFIENGDRNYHHSNYRAVFFKFSEGIDYSFDNVKELSYIFYKEKCLEQNHDFVW